MSEATRETIIGTLQRHKMRKAERDWVKDYARGMAEDAGLVPVRYWPETVVVHGDDMSPYGRAMIWDVNRRIKAFEGVPHGARVRFTATVQRWANGIGGDVSRIKNLKVLAEEAVRE